MPFTGNNICDNDRMIRFLVVFFWLMILPILRMTHLPHAAFTKLADDRVMSYRFSCVHDFSTSLFGR